MKKKYWTAYLLTLLVIVIFLIIAGLFIHIFNWYPKYYEAFKNIMGGKENATCIPIHGYWKYFVAQLGGAIIIAFPIACIVISNKDDE